MSADTPVAKALREIERHVSEAGWDQPTRLFALVSTAELISKEPSLAVDLAGRSESTELSSVEQDELPQHDELGDLLASMFWPPSVLGVAIVAERIVVPKDSEAELVSDPVEAKKLAAKDPHRHELRVAAAAMRDGSRYSLLRLREHDDDDALVAGPEVMGGLCDLLASSLTD